MTFKATTIIVTYNGLKWIDKCLTSLLLSDYKVKIIVIDNLSTDGTPEYISKNFSHVHLIKSKENVGFGKANNIGIIKACQDGSDYFFLLNQDAWVENDTIRKLVTHLHKSPEYGLISPMHLNGEGTALDYNFSNYISPWACKNLYSDIFLNNIKDEIYEIQFVNAAAWLISKECIEKVGGFSPVFFQYGEDDNYIHRVLYHGFKIGIYPLTRIFHDRENRILLNPDQNIGLEKRHILIKYSNPNSIEIIADLIKLNNQNLVKSILVFKWKSAKYYLNMNKELRLLNIDILKSLNKSKIVGHTFLEKIIRIK